MLSQEYYVTREIYPGVWDIGDKRGGEAPGVDAYLVLGEQKALLLDGCQSLGDLRGVVESITALPVEALVLHGHDDHIGSIQQFDRVYMSPLDLPVTEFYHPEDHFDGKKTLPLTDGMVFDLGGRRLELIAAPGHTPGSFVTLDRENALLFSSDSVGSGYVWMQIVNTTDLATYGATCAALYEKVKEIPNLVLLTGHANQHTQTLTAAYIADQAQLAAGIVSGEIKGQPMAKTPGARKDQVGMRAELPRPSCGVCGICYDPHRLTPPTREDYVAREIYPGVWDIGDKRGGAAPGVDAYLVLGENKALLLDGCQSLGDLRGVVEEITSLPVEAVVLHGHSDHTGNIQQFKTVYMSALDAPVIDLFPDCPFDPARTLDLTDGTVFDLGGRRLELIATPGHTPGSFVALDRENALLFSSDSVGSGFVWMQLPFCSALSVYAETCQTLYEKVKEIPDLILLTGHANQHPLPLTAQYIADQAALAREIVAGRAEISPMDGYDEMPEIFRGYQAFRKDRLCGICFNPKNL